jgi:pimeloyl-ACP methyl ester carboxylesterase
VIQFQTVDLDEVQLHYAEAPGPGPTLVMIHGITGSHATFLPLMPALAQQAHVYALDLRGHNLSGYTPGEYRVQDYGRDVVAFLQRVVGQPAIVAGHSMGAVVAVWLAAQAPDSVHSVFLEDPPLYVTQPPRLHETWFYGFFMALREQLRQHHANRGTLDDLIPSVGQWPANAEQTLLEAAGPEAVRLKATELHRLDPTVLDVALDGVFLGSHEPDALLTQAHMPIHLIAGQAALGGAMDAHDVQRFVAMAPHSTHEVVEGVGHMIHDERPEEYVQAVRQFISLSSKRS